MAWHGVAECLLPLALLSISAGPRDWVSWRGGESEITNASCQGLRQHIILQARRRSRRSEQQPRSPTRALTHAWRYRQCQPQTQTRHAGLASSLSMGPSDVQHGRGLQVITFSLTLSLDASRICMRAERQASSCASAPQPGELNPTPAVILSLGPRLARRFARSLHLHPYNCALLHRCMPPCFARVLLLSPPRFPFALQTSGRLALFKHSCL
jgi:hypothetical protein